MVKHTQAICRQIADELFECVWLFCRVDAERVNKGMIAILVHVFVALTIEWSLSVGAWYNCKQ